MSKADFLLRNGFDKLTLTFWKKPNSVSFEKNIKNLLWVPHPDILKKKELSVIWKEHKKLFISASAWHSEKNELSVIWKEHKKLFISAPARP